MDWMGGRSMTTFDFKERLAFSKGRRQQTDLETIQAMIDGCVNVRIANEQQDRRGIDYIATLDSGVEVRIDPKSRDAGASQYWTRHNDDECIPDLALEDWSVVPDNRQQGVIGWTLDKRKETDLVLFTFDPTDTDRCYIVSFQLLRVAFERHKILWLKQYWDAPQPNNGWTSHCVFVPVNVVFRAIMGVQCGRIDLPIGTHHGSHVN